MPSTPVIALLTDFGLTDPYAGQMKAAIIQEHPAATIVDLSHDVAPHSIGQAAFFLTSSRMHFPPETIFTCVVDPGVGSDRGIVCIRFCDQYIIAPDNGLAHPLLATGPLTLTPAKAWMVDMAHFPDADSTFHGRDVFAPLAARLAKGAQPGSFGPSIDPEALMQLQWPQPFLQSDALHCHVLHVDKFGNAVLDLSIRKWRSMLASWHGMVLDGPEPRPVHCVTTYADIPPGPETLGILPGSQGYLEISCNKVSAAALLGLSVETQLTILRTS